MKEFKYTALYAVSVRTYVVSFCYGSASGSGTVIPYGSGSDFLAIYGSGSAGQKVTIHTVPVPQRCLVVDEMDALGAAHNLATGEEFHDLLGGGGPGQPTGLHVLSFVLAHRAAFISQLSRLKV
jgi:hypothetical protein